MGQYHFICNIDKKEFLHPHHLGDGLKLLEFGCSADATLTALAVLLAASNGRGGGDLHIDPQNDRDRLIAEHIVGRWAGDRIAIIGDYHEQADVPDVTDVQVSDTGRYSGMVDGKPSYDLPLYGDVPWNDSGLGYGDNGPDLGWIDISSLAVEAIELDGYIKNGRSERRSWGEDGPTAILHDDGLGTVTRASKSVPA